MSTNPGENEVTARRYLAALEAGATGDELAQFFTPDVVQHEFPNRLVPNGAQRDLRAILDAAIAGKRVLTSQSFQLANSVAIGNQVALEVKWTGNLALPVGTLPAGAVMKALFAVFLVFRDGKIARQHNYDCFEPW